MFYRLSKILKRRTPDQCRSHHQKLQLKFKDDLKAIMSEVQKKIQKCMAEEYVNQQHNLFQFKFPMTEYDQRPSIESDREEELING